MKIAQNSCNNTQASINNRMQLEFLQQLDEGRALSRTSQLGDLDVEDVMRLLFLELGAVMLFQHDAAAQNYAKKTLDGGAFQRWRMFGTDLYNAAVALNSTEYRTKLKISHGTVNVPLLQKILRDASGGRAKATDYGKFTMDMQRSFGVNSSLLASIRRRIADFEHLSREQRDQLLGDMGRYYAPFGSKSDMLGISVQKTDTGSSHSLLAWALKMGVLAAASYQFGKWLAR